jgi:FixJ family two-component response regulator
MAQRKVALVDNDPLMLRAIERLLKARGFDVAPYTSAEAFLDHGAKDKLTCLVLDINLGGISGIALSRKLTASGSNIPVIFMTAFDSPRTRHEAIDAGCVAYLLKPFPASMLVGAIDKAG